VSPEFFVSITPGDIVGGTVVAASRSVKYLLNIAADLRASR
jgi:hypothetical protein